MSKEHEKHHEEKHEKHEKKEKEEPKEEKAAPKASGVTYFDPEDPNATPREWASVPDPVWYPVGSMNPPATTKTQTVAVNPPEHSAPVGEKKEEKKK
jgi:hypothetical protein